MLLLLLSCRLRAATPLAAPLKLWAAVVCRWDYLNLCCSRRRSSCWLWSVAIYPMCAGEWVTEWRCVFSRFLLLFVLGFLVFFFCWFLLVGWLHSTAKFAPFLYFKWCVKGHAGVDEPPYPLPGSSCSRCLGRRINPIKTRPAHVPLRVCVWVVSIICIAFCLLRGEVRQRVGERHSYLICHLISNMRHEFRTPFPRHLRPILINSQLISYEFLSEFSVGWQFEEDSFGFKCQCLHFQWELKIKQPGEGIKNLQEKLQSLLKTFKRDSWIAAGVCCGKTCTEIRSYNYTVYFLYSSTLSYSLLTAQVE